jgi:DNA transformation protein
VSADDSLLEILQDALSPRGTVTGRRMFGGIGVYFDGIFFAIIASGVIYFRVSEATRPSFQAERSRPFTYATKNGPAELGSYWRLPERLLDDPDELADWANDAVAAARIVQTEKERKGSAKRKRATRGEAVKPKAKPVRSRSV